MLDDSVNDFSSYWRSEWFYWGWISRASDFSLRRENYIVAVQSDVPSSATVSRSIVQPREA